jgi:hypothetical protein
MWRKPVRSASRSTIHSGFLIQTLRSRGAVHYCVNCGERMFVKYESGLCPFCFNGRRDLHLEEPVHVVSDADVLAGVLDDPAIEVVPEPLDRIPTRK